MKYFGYDELRERAAPVWLLDEVRFVEDAEAEVFEGVRVLSQGQRALLGCHHQNLAGTDDGEVLALEKGILGAAEEPSHLYAGQGIED